MSIATEIVREPGVEPYRWSAAQFMSAVNAGLIKRPRGVEMLEGIVVVESWCPNGRAPDGPGVDPYRWSVDEFQEIVDAGLIDDPHRVELLNGIMAWKMPPGDDHDFTNDALHLAFAAMGAYARGLMSTPRIVLGEHGVYEPDYALFREGVIGRFGPKRESDILWVVEVSVTSLYKDLNQKRDAYARAGIPHYWVLDAERRGLWVFSRPEGGIYREERRVTDAVSVSVPYLGGFLDTASLFPSNDA